MIADGKLSGMGESQIGSGRDKKLIFSKIRNMEAFGKLGPSQDFKKF